MEYLHMRLSYTAEPWNDIVERTVSFDDRLSSVRRLIRGLGGSLADHHLYDDEHFGSDGGHNKRHAVTAKFVPFGQSDIIAVLAMPDSAAAEVFSMAVTSEPGVKGCEMIPSLGRVRDAMASATYAAPGRRERARAAPN